MKRKIVCIFVMMLLIASAVFSVSGIVKETKNFEIQSIEKYSNDTVKDSFEMSIDSYDSFVSGDLELSIYSSSEITANNDIYHIYEGLHWKLYVTAYWNPPQGVNICLWVDPAMLPTGAIFPECNCAIDKVTSTLDWTPAVGQAGTYYITFYVGESCYETMGYFTVEVIVHPYEPDPQYTYEIFECHDWHLTVTAYWVPPQPERLICLWVDTSTLPEGATFTDCHCDYGEVISDFYWHPQIGQAGEYIITFLYGDTCGYYKKISSIKVIVLPGGEEENIVFNQLDFNLDGVETLNSDWGVADLSFIGSENIQYFNLITNGVWSIRNIPILNLKDEEIEQTQRFWFPLGVSVGTDVTTIKYGYELTDYIKETPPIEDMTAPVGNGNYVVYNSGDYEEFPVVPVIAGVVEGGKAVKPQQHRHTNFPNQDAGKYECAPAAVSNSLKFLKKKHNLNIKDSDITIEKMKEACGFQTNKGCPRDTWWKIKDAYMKKNEIPITTRHFTRNQIGLLAAEIDRGQDIEMELYGHTVSIVGIVDLGGGRYSITIAHDETQGPSGNGGKVTETGIYNSKTGKWEKGPLAKYAGINYFVVECPEKEWLKTVELKFFSCVPKLDNEKINKMVKEVNDIYRCQWINDIQFCWNGKIVQLPKWICDLKNGDQLRAVRNFSKNCSRGINVVIHPPGTLGALGVCSFRVCNGVAKVATGGIKIEDTCNATDMGKTLSHELLHAFGLSHEAQNHPLAAPIPPHGQQLPGGGWDFDNPPNGVDKSDKEKLLWGDDTGTGTKITISQYKYIWNNAEKIPGIIKERHPMSTKTTPVPQPKISTSAVTIDGISDIPPGFGYVDIIGSISTNCWDLTDNISSFTMEVADSIPNDKNLRYSFYLNTDNNEDTGYPGEVFPGADYVADLDITPESTSAILWRFIGGKWVYDGELDYSEGPVVKDFYDRYRGWEEGDRGYAPTLFIPLESLNLMFEGDIQIRAVALDLDSDISDLCSVMSMSQEIVFAPLIELDPSSGSRCEDVTVYGTNFAPNSNISIEFNGVELAIQDSDNEGSFTTSFKVPSLNEGLYEVKAVDDSGHFDFTLFYVEFENHPPDEPMCRYKRLYDELLVFAKDDDNDEVRYGLSWDNDGVIDEWTAFYSSGVEVSISCEERTGTVGVIAEDEYGAQSDWSSVKSKNTAIKYPSIIWFFKNFVQSFPFMVRILNQIV